MSNTNALAVRYVATKRAAHQFTPTSARTVRYTLSAFAVHCPDDARKIRRRHVDRWLASQKVGPASVRSRLGSVRAFCRWLMMTDVLQRDPCLGITAPKAPRRVPRAMPADQRDHLLCGVDDMRLRLAFSLMFCEGLRRAEVTSLQVGDVDWDRALLRVIGKGDKERVVPLTPATTDAIRRYLAQQRISSGVLIRSKKHPHRGITPDALGKLVVVEMYRLGVKHHARDGRSSHAGRHTAITDLADLGVPLLDLQQFAGHADPSTTFVYVGLRDPERLRAPSFARSYAQARAIG